MITVLQGGTQTTIQDTGRWGYRHLGIPSGGAADRLSFGLANWLVGNHWDQPALECSLGGLHIRFEKTMTVGLAGAEMWAQINGQNVNNFTSLPVHKGDILTLSFARDGCRAYIAVTGGLKASPFLGSVSTYIPAGFGGLDGRSLRAGDALIVGTKHLQSPQSLDSSLRPRLSRHIVLRARPGPEIDWLDDPSRRHLFINPFEATPATSRMGSRLRGNHISLLTPREMVSSPLLPGTVQVPKDGQPLLAMADGHCTGGYPRILQIIKADHWQLGQIAPGSKVSFRRASATEAVDILKRRSAFYRALMPQFSF